MPLIKSAIKKMRVDRRRQAHNQAILSQLKTLLTKAQASKEEILIKQATSLLDKAAQSGLIHRNKASRRKSRLMKLASHPEKSVKLRAKESTKKTKTKRAVLI